ncbi:Gfo/Idh/MocA family oxidoreductase [Demequina sp.]|uniref:Gfo/Idh/MocA family protein n=1 Tax=Demequina sp. TaxID=2050685 RepID=UPI0025CD49C8|nr:Gfo/Idh/MocA family oxidoreductase [Demequina sp.]
MNQPPAVRIGILGAARIVKDALLKPVADVEGVELAAIAARDVDRATAYALAHGIPTVHGSYQELLEDPDIDAVYVPLPAALHGEWTVRAARAGKHVLCEKPFTASLAEAEAVRRDTADAGVVVMEAYHTHFHPHMAAIRAVLDSGEIGPVVSAQATFCIPIPSKKDIRWSRELGGGGLLDVGYYPVRMLRELFGDAPEVRAASAKLRGDVDRLVTADLDFPGGVTGRIVSSMWAFRPLGASLRITGERGRIDVPWPYHPQMSGRVKVRMPAGSRVERVTRRSTYAFQLDAFRDAVLGDAPVETGVEAAVAQMSTLAAIYSAAGVDLGR